MKNALQTRGVETGRLSERSRFGYQPGIDGLRAISIILVFGSHYVTDRIPGGLGVTIFFFISGYLICSLLYKEICDTDRLNFRNFYLRRALRLSPALYVSIVLSALAFYISFGVFSPFSIIAAFTYLYNYAELWAGKVAYPIPLWSLAIEEHFYLMFPVSLLVLTRRFSLRSAILIYAAAALSILLWRVVLTIFYDVNWYRIYIGTDTRIDSILFGVILALILQDDRLRCKVASIADERLLAVGLFLLMLSLVIRNDVYRQTLRYTLQGVGLLFAIVPIVLGNYPTLLKSIVESKPLRYIAKLSYSFYLYHLVVLFWLHRLAILQPGGTVIAAGLISVSLSLLSYYFVERPALRMRRAFGSNAVD